MDPLGAKRQKEPLKGGTAFLQPWPSGCGVNSFCSRSYVITALPSSMVTCFTSPWRYLCHPRIEEQIGDRRHRAQVSVSPHFQLPYCPGRCLHQSGTPVHSLPSWLHLLPYMPKYTSFSGQLWLFYSVRDLTLPLSHFILLFSLLLPSYFELRVHLLHYMGSWSRLPGSRAGSPPHS